MNKYEYQIQLQCVKGNVSRQIPTFILPALLGLTGFESALKTVKEMFVDCELHGSIMNHNSQVFTF